MSLLVILIIFAVLALIGAVLWFGIMASDNVDAEDDTLE